MRCRRETEKDAAAEPLLSSFLYASILSHDNFERSLAFVLSNRLSDATFLSTELFEVFYSILRTKPEIAEAALADIRAVRERVRLPPSCCLVCSAHGSSIDRLQELGDASCQHGLMLGLVEVIGLHLAICAVDLGRGSPPVANVMCRSGSCLIDA